MTAKEFLGQVYKSHDEITDLQEQIEQLRDDIVKNSKYCRSYIFELHAWGLRLIDDSGRVPGTEVT